MPTARRKSHRLSTADYTLPGAYFVTFCVQEHACDLGEVVDGCVKLSKEGEIVERVWRDLPAHYPYVELGECMVMPNHVHAVVWIVEDKTFEGSATEASGQDGIPTTGAGLRSGSPDRFAIHRPAPTGVHGEIENSHTGGDTYPLDTNPVGAGLLNAEQAGFQTRRPAPSQADTPPNGRSPHIFTPIRGLSEIIRAWKSFSTRRINLYRNTPGIQFWQRSYYDHIIRNVKDLELIANYIQANPDRWEMDK